MKSVLILAFALWSTSTFGQAPTSKVHGIIISPNKDLQNDSSLKVVYADKESNIKKPAYFLNNKFISGTLFSTLNPMLIESINILKENIQIDGILYYGQIQIRTKNNYSPQIISLRELKEKYTNLKNKSTIFMVDEVIVNADYDNYFVDENYLLKIVVDKVENTKENIDLGLIKLLTKSDENIKNSKNIRIRGTEVVTLIK